MWTAKIKPRLIQAIKTFSQAWTACALMMVQGNLSVFSWHHAATATSTGFYAALGVLLAIHLRPDAGKWFIAWATGIVTTFAERLMHSSQFGGDMTEALLTGFGAFLLAIIFDATRFDRD